MHTMRAVVAAATIVALVALAPGVVRASASRRSRQRFCVPIQVIVDEIQKPVLEVAASRAPVLALTLKHTARAAPRAVARSMRTMAATYTALAKAKSDPERVQVAFAHATAFTAAAKTMADYYAVHCVAPPVSSPNLPGVGAANEAACLADARALQIAETEYSALNGEFGTMSQLVGAGLVRVPSRFHPEITVGTPPGGYTVVGNQGCNDLPVAG
jgi:hypothetical protein